MRKIQQELGVLFEIAAYDQGANITYLGSRGNQIGVKESMIDAARVLGRMYDFIGFRGSSQQTVECLANYSNVPVYNGLTATAHPQPKYYRFNDNRRA